MKQHSVMHGAIYLTVSALIVKLFGVVFKIPLTYIIGDVGMGYFNSAYTVYSLFYIVFNAGIPRALTVVSSSLIYKNEHEKVGYIFKRIFKYIFISASLVMVITFFLSGSIAGIIGNNKSHFSIIAISPSILFVSLCGVCKGYLIAYERFIHVATSGVIESIAKLIFGLLFAICSFRTHSSVEVVSSFAILGISVGSLISLIYLILAIKLERKEKTRQKVYIGNKNEFKEIFKIAGSLTFSSLITSLSAILEVSLIYRGLGFSGVNETEQNALFGIYSTLSLPMVSLVGSLLAPISQASLPKLVLYNEKGNRSEFDSLFKKSLIPTLFIGVIAFYVFLLYPFDLLDILFESKASVTGSYLLMLLSPASVLLPLLTLFNTALESQKRVISVSTSLLIGSISRLFLLMFLTERLGIASASISTTVSYMVSFIFSFILLKDTGEYLRIIFEYLFCGAVSFLPIYLLFYRSGVLGAGIIPLIVSVAASFVVFLVLIFRSLRAQLNAK